MKTLIALAAVISSLAMPGVLHGAAPGTADLPESSSTPLGSEPPEEDEGVDWASVAIGAGAVMSVIALSGAGVLTVRRRRTDQRSAAASRALGRRGG